MMSDTDRQGVRENREQLLARILVLRALFVALLVLVGVGYWRVQVAHGARYRALAENNRLRRHALHAARGLIYDRHGRLLVENVPSYDLELVRSRSRDLRKSLEFAAGILGRPRQVLETVVARYRAVPASNRVLVAEDLSLAQVARFGVASLEQPEFEIAVRQLRLYRHGPQTAHVLGYLGEASPAELRPGSPYRAGDLLGRSGVEQTYEAELRGVDGRQVVVVDSRGRLIDEFEQEAAQPGRDLRLTLDLDLQQEAARYFRHRVGAAVALDPRNGEILALVSSPAYDPNRFARRLERSEWQAILDQPDRPLHNRATQSAYSPGSVFKIVMGVAGLVEGVIQPQDKVFCPGSAVFYRRRFRCWKRGGHGWVDLHEALRQSCDVYFYKLGEALGIERIARYARLFGFGAKTGIDIAGEGSGLVPSLTWSLRERGIPWYPGETISVAIGQGPLLVTPLQLAVMVAAVANGGRRVTPHLALDHSPRPERSTGLPGPVLAAIGEALRAVVNDRGTGAAARVEGLEIAGKTGTVQVVAQRTWIDNEELPPSERDHAWFVSYGPVTDPRLAVVVFVEHGGKGSTAAAPLARILYETYLRNPDSSSRAS